MSDLESRLHDALTGEADLVRPARDLSSRVRDSVDADRRTRRHRRARAASVGVAGAATTVALVWGMTRSASSRRPDEGGSSMTWWMVELAANALLVVIALWLGPFIKRFGRAYAADVFHDNPLTGKSYIVLTDVVYYLIFTAYILFTVRFEPSADWFGAANGDVSAAQLRFEVQRIAGILLIIGVLHGLNIVFMPALGRLFSLNRRLAAPTTVAPSEREVISGDDDQRSRY